MADTIMEAVRDYLNTCPALSSFPASKRHIDWTDADSDNYGIIADGETQTRKFISGGGKYRYDFSLYINRVTYSDEQALITAGFLERLRDWCNAQSLCHDLPVLPDGYTAVKLSAENGMLAEIPKNRKYGKYFIQFKLFYIRH